MRISLESHHKWSLPHHHKHMDTDTFTADATTGDAPTLVQRSATSSSSCSAGDNSGTCQRPAESGNTSSITIAVAAAVPIVVAAIVLFFLHRRVRRKHRQEDADDKYKSLDFGLDHVPTNKSARMGKGAPEMTVTDMEKSTTNMVRGTHGLSMDMSSPYLLPAPVNNSRESFHSMSRSLRDEDDPYRPVTFIRSDSDSLHSGAANRSLKPGNASTYTRSSDRTNDGIDAGLLTNASTMSRSDPFAIDSPDSVESHDFPPPPPPVHLNKTVNSRTSFAASAAPRAKPAPPLLSLPEPDDEPFHVTPPSPPQHLTPPAPPAPPVHQVQVEISPAEDNGLQAAPAADARRVSVMGLRPLPPDDPLDNPEQRANRIRSFYKEYFDDSKPNPPGQYPQAQHQYQNSYEAHIYDDYSAYMYEAPPAPFAEPVGRRAMTPPPRAFPAGRVRSNTSFGSTGHIGNPAFRQAPKKKLPPPIALNHLPTPHAMTDDMAMAPISFAPPVTFRDRQAGRRPQSPAVPYSPSVRAHTPLTTSFDDLNVLPSAHALRKSSTFTSLDFALPPRFRNEGTASDAGSIRSNRSGISNMQQNAIRAGAYRVSRLPTDMVGTQKDLAQALKPNWDLGTR